MRVRLLKPGFFKNEDLARVPAEGRLLYAGLWLLADREGRLEDRPGRIQIELFPYERAVDVNGLLRDLAGAGFIRRYVTKGRACIAIPTFRDHQQPHLREAASTLPAPPARRSTCLGKDEHLPRQGRALDEHLPRSPVFDPVSVSRSKKDQDQRADARPVHKLLETIAHGVLDARDQGQIPDLDAELADELKTRAAQARIPYDGRAVTKALESATFQRQRIRTR